MLISVCQLLIGKIKKATAAQHRGFNVKISLAFQILQYFIENHNKKVQYDLIFFHSQYGIQIFLITR